MTTETSKDYRSGSRAKVLATILASFAVSVMIASAILALKNQEDTFEAMKLPAALGFWSVVAFIYAQKRTLPKRPNQPSTAQRP